MNPKKIIRKMAKKLKTSNGEVKDVTEQEIEDLKEKVKRDEQ